MKTQGTLLQRLIVLILAGIFAAGCGSMRIVSTLKPSYDSGIAIDNIRFRIADFSLIYDKTDIQTINYVKSITEELLHSRAMALYPEIFSDRWTALPVAVTASAKVEPHPAGALMSGFTAGVIPFPSSFVVNIDIDANVRGPDGEALVKGDTTHFEVSEVIWVSLIGPLGCIPVPGQSDLPRDGIFLFIPLTRDAYSKTKLPTYIADCMVEAIVKKLRAIDPAILNAAYKARVSGLQDVKINGRVAWCFLAPVISEKEGRAFAFRAFFYRNYPKQNAKPFEVIEVAKKGPDGRWFPETGYLRSASTLTAVTAVMDKGVPVKVVVKEVTEPPIEDFINLPAKHTADDIRWNNQVLIDAKNSSLLTLMSRGSRQEITGLITRIEKAMLNLIEKVQMADSKAKQIVLNGGDPTAVNRMAVLYRQRITIFKSILSALKRAVAR